MKILKSKKSLTIFGGAAAFVVVASLSIGLGVGLSHRTDSGGNNPTPTPTPTTKKLNFTTSNSGSSIGTVLYSPLSNSDEVNGLVYLENSTPSAITFEGSSLTSALNITMRTGSSNKFLVTSAFFYIPINPVSIGQTSYSYVTLFVDNDDTIGSYIYFNGLSTGVGNLNLVLLSLTNSPSAELDFAVSN